MMRKFAYLDMKELGKRADFTKKDMEEARNYHEQEILPAMDNLEDMRRASLEYIARNPIILD